MLRDKVKYVMNLGRQYSTNTLEVGLSFHRATLTLRPAPTPTLLLTLALTLAGWPRQLRALPYLDYPRSVSVLAFIFSSFTTFSHLLRMYIPFLACSSIDKSLLKLFQQRMLGNPRVRNLEDTCWAR